MKKYILALLSLIFASSVAFSLENDFKNKLEGITFKKTGEASYNIELSTQKQYREPIKVIKKTDTNYYLLLPETNTAISSANTTGDIKSADIKMYSYAGQDLNNGYTKINIFTSRPVSFTTSLITSANTAPTIDKNKLAQLDNAFNKVQTTSSNDTVKTTVQTTTKPSYKPQNAGQTVKPAQKTTTQVQPVVQQKTAQTKPAQKVLSKEEIAAQKKAIFEAQYRAKMAQKTASAQKTTTAQKVATTQKTTAAQKPAQTVQKQTIQQKQATKTVQKPVQTTQKQTVTTKTTVNKPIQQQKPAATRPTVNTTKPIQKPTAEPIEEKSLASNPSNDGKKPLKPNFVPIDKPQATQNNADLSNEPALKLPNRAKMEEETENQVQEENLKTDYLTLAKSFIKARLEGILAISGLTILLIILIFVFKKKNNKKDEKMEKNNQIQPEIKAEDNNEADIQSFLDEFKGLSEDEPTVQKEPEAAPQAEVEPTASVQTIEETTVDEQVEQAQDDEPYIEPELLSSVEIAPNRGFMLIDQQGKKALFGYIREDVYFLYSFKEFISNYEIKFRISEQQEDKTFFIVKVDKTKLLVRVTNAEMKLELEM